MTTKNINTKAKMEKINIATQANCNWQNNKTTSLKPKTTYRW